MGAEMDTVKIAPYYYYEPLKLGYRNLSDLLGTDEHYIWVKIDFSITDDLKNKSLGFVVPYIHFSEQTWVNDVYLGQMGTIGKDAISSLYSSKSFFIPKELVNQEGQNTIYMKVLSKGRSSIAEGLFIDVYDHALSAADELNFIHTRIYLVFEGILLASFVVLLILFFGNCKNISVFIFSLICLFTSILLTYFCGSEMEGYKQGIISHINFTKIFLCCGLYLSLFSILGFMISFIEIKQPGWFLFLKHCVLVFIIIITFAAPDYDALISLCKPMISLLFGYSGLCFVLIIRSLFFKETRRRAIIILSGFSLLIVSMLVDIVLRHYMRNINYPYFAIFGWQLTIGFFVVYLSMNFNRTFRQNELLNTNLRQEVRKQTAGLHVANMRLVNELDRADNDLTMAAIVQQKFFPKPENRFNDWDFAVEYNPLSKVSGDLFDFYSDDFEPILDGFSIFDASGHGVAAALVTMLSKNIIHQAFYNSMAKKTPLKKAMEEVNDTFIDEKGDIENYLTGLMLRFKELDSESSDVEMAIAGHSYPVLYSADTCDMVDLKKRVEGIHYGAVGMAEMLVDYADLNFVMKKNDVLLCFTDGITETENDNNEEFGRARLEVLLKEINQSSAEDIIKIIKQRLNEFRGSAPLKDDISMIVFKRK